MSAAQDPFLDNLGLFTELLDGQLGLEVGPQELVTTCGDREEIVAYLLLKTRLLQASPGLAEQMKVIARITAQASRAPVQSSTLEDVVGIADGNTRICRTLQDIFGSDLASSPLAKELEHARHRLAIERLAEGLGDQAMFDRINPN